jgi:hypothetical protein
MDNRVVVFLVLGIELQCQDKKRYVSHDTQAGQHDDDVTTSTKSLPAQAIVADFAEELPVPLHTPEGTHSQHASAIYGE